MVQWKIYLQVLLLAMSYSLLIGMLPIWLVGQSVTNKISPSNCQYFILHSRRAVLGNWILGLTIRASQNDRSTFTDNIALPEAQGKKPSSKKVTRCEELVLLKHTTMHESWKDAAQLNILVAETGCYVWPWSLPLPHFHIGERQAKKSNNSLPLTKFCKES